MTKKIFIIIVKIFVAIVIIQTTIMPTSNALSDLGNVLQYGDDFIEEGKNQGSTLNTIDLSDTTDTIYNILVALGVVAAVIVGAILGIQIMWGSIEQQTKAKEALLPYTISIVVIFGAFGIWKLCVSIFSQL